MQESLELKTKKGEECEANTLIIELSFFSKLTSILIHTHAIKTVAK